MSDEQKEDTQETIADPVVAQESALEEDTSNQTEESSVPDEEPTADHRHTLKAGMTVVVHEKIKDINSKGEVKERIQKFEGMILGIRGAGLSRTMTIRKISKGGFDVEKIFPLASPVIEKIVCLKEARVRRAKLTYLKNPKRPFKRKLKETKMS